VAAGSDIAADITAAVQHITDRETRWATHDATHGIPRREVGPAEDWADAAWQHSRQQAARARDEAAAQAGATGGDLLPPF
jgi:hypothetical protein